MAGLIGEQRALQGSSPGYRRVLTEEELTAFHEASHAVVAIAAGWHAHKLELDPPVAKVETGGVVLAYCLTGPSLQRTAVILETAVEFRSDRRRIAAMCFAVAGDWKGALQRVRSLREKTKDLVEERWQDIHDLAWELVRYRHLDQAQIRRIVES